MQNVDVEKLLALSYVFVSRDKAHTSNVFGGFLPFVLAAAKPVSGTKVDPHNVGRRLREGFGWDVGGDFVSLYAGDLLREGLVERRGEDLFWTDAVAKTDEVPEIEALRLAFFEFSESLAGNLFHNLGAEERLHQLATALVTNRLFSTDTLEAFASIDDADEKPPTDVDYVCARFVRHCFRHDQGNFDALLVLAQLGIICQLGTFFSRPPPTERITGRLLLVLDGPFLVDLLGFGGEDRRADAALTVKLARERKARIVVFAHSVDEARDVIRGVLLNEPALRFGPTAAALRNGSVSQPMLDIFVQTPRQIVEGSKLVDEIISHNDRRLGTGAEFFDNEDWQVLFGNLSGWTKDLARKRDCDSVRDVMRLRKGASSSGVWGAGAVMLTSNLRLARISKQVSVDRDLIDPTSIGPVISRFQLAALLWWAGGSKEKTEIASAHLMASASAFLSRDGTLVRKVQQYALGVDTQRRELVDAFVRTPLSYEFLQDATLGGSLDVDERAVSHVLDRLVEHGREEGAQVERAKVQAQIDQERAVAEAAEAAIQKLAEAKRAAEMAAVQSESERASAEVARAAAEAEVAAYREARDAAEASAREREGLALREIERARRSHAIVIGLLQSREAVWSGTYRVVVVWVGVARWVLIAALCVGVAIFSTAATKNAGMGWFLGAIAFFSGLGATRLFDGGRAWEREVTRKLCRSLLEPQRTQLNDELGARAPDVVLDISEAGVSISNKEEIVAAFDG